jgi:putative ATP-dependent endonuclease of OLD family
MHLKSLKIDNFRKFGTKGNIVDFVAGTSDSTVNKVAASTTLIVGKNNSGKTTIAAALEKLASNNNDINGNDFNLMYLDSFLKIFRAALPNQKIVYPSLEFKIVVNIDGDAGDLVTRCGTFLSVGDTSINTDDFDLVIVAKYQIRETEKFAEKLKKIIDKHLNNESLVFSKMIDLLNTVPFKCSYYSASGVEEQNNFRLSELIDVNIITPNKNLEDKSLSKIFNKIIKYKYSLDSELENRELLDDELLKVNDLINKQINRHDKSANDVLETIESSQRMGVSISSDINFKDIVNNLIKYEYTEFGFSIPENQFGLGYTNLMSIIGEMIDYVERYPIGESQSKINLICIEEPESFMHPQMQELFIKYIDDAIKHLLNTNGTGKNINSQLVITTHSSHILNSKIHSSKSFNNINYVTNTNNYSNVIRLNDEVIRSANTSVIKSETTDEVESETTDEVESETTDETIAIQEKKSYEELKFLKKHIKYKVSELFFSDAIIIVEGITEETLLNYYIDHNDALKKYYISIFNINGAHGQIYHGLIKLLKIPTLIITDLDIERKPEELTQKDADDKDIKIYPQIRTLEGRESTNSTITKFNNNNNKIDALPSNYFEDENLYCVFQKDSCKGIFATSFEEAFILENHDNPMLNSVLLDLKPKVYEKIVGKSGAEDFSMLIENSYKLQRKLSDSKSDFANKLLYKLILSEPPNINPSLPTYINTGLKWLEGKVSKSLQGGS